MLMTALDFDPWDIINKYVGKKRAPKEGRQFISEKGKGEVGHLQALNKKTQSSNLFTVHTGC